MSNLSNIVDLAREIGLEGEELKQFVLRKESEEKEAIARAREDEREARAQAREDRKLELELEAEKSRREFELRKLELEARRGGSGDRQVAEATRRPAFPKLPVFNETSDSIDAYLLRFERLASSAKWDKDVWAISLASLLQGKALETYQHLSPAEAQDYEEVKAALLKCFQCTAEGYKLKFRGDKFRKTETALQFGNKLLEAEQTPIATVTNNSSEHAGICGWVMLQTFGFV